MDGQTSNSQRRRKIAVLLMLILGMWLSLYVPPPQGSRRGVPREPLRRESPPNAASNLSAPPVATDGSLALYAFKQIAVPSNATSSSDEKKTADLPKDSGLLAAVKNAPSLTLNAPILPEHRDVTEPTSNHPSGDTQLHPAVKSTAAEPLIPIDVPSVKPVVVQPVSIQPLTPRGAAVPGTGDLLRPASSALKAKVLHVNQTNFNQHVLGSQTTVLVDFYAGWCVPCKALAPMLEEVAGETPKARVVKVNIDESPQLAARYGIKSVPSLMVFKDGKIRAVQTGMASKARVKAMLDLY